MFCEARKTASSELYPGGHGKLGRLSALLVAIALMQLWLQHDSEMR